MANAKRCDICGKYYDVPELDEEFAHNANLNTSMVRILRLKSVTCKHKHEVMQFDSCDNCLQDVIDYMLTKRVDATCQG